MYMPYILKYDYNALEPYISKKTLETHYNSHYLKYLKNLNDLLIKNNFKFEYPKKDLYKNINNFPIDDRENILFNLGGVVNHELYFDSMIPSNNKIIPNILNDALINNFGSIDNFVNKFLELASSLKGSGYTFLSVLDDGSLCLMNLPNQDSPYSLGIIPILSIDLWEHAYYLDYRNDRKLYSENFLKLINFDEVNKKYIKNL